MDVIIKLISAYLLVISSLKSEDIPNKPKVKATKIQATVADQPTFSCTMPAYLFQGDNTDAYSVDLSTGKTTLVKNNLIPPGDDRQIQAVGYNVLDNYLWGYRSGTNQLVRIGGDWSVQFFTIPDLAIAQYKIGDIDANGVMYLSVSGANIIRIDLNPASLNYLQLLPALPSTGSTIADWSISVVDGNIYAVSYNSGSNSSQLFRYNTSTGTRTTLGTVDFGETNDSGFGASYSDSQGNLYVQNNQTGKVYKIDKPHLLPASTTAQISGNLFANTGMTTSSNDGTRCMNAPPPCQAPNPPAGVVIQPACGATTGTISITAPTGADIQFSLNEGEYQSNSQFTGLLPGVYSITAKNISSNCTSLASSFTIVSAPITPSSPTITASSSATFCLGSSLLLTSSAATNNQWYRNGILLDGATSVTLSVINSGTYTAAVTNASGCTAVSLGFPVEVNTLTTPTMSVVQPSCTLATGSITITSAISGVEYSFDNGATYQASNVKSGLASGVYIAKVKSTLSGCESASINATVNAAPSVPAMPTVSIIQPTCAVSKGTIAVTSPLSGVMYSFDNGLTYQAGASKSGLSSGVYIVKVKSTLTGCESTPASVTVNTVPVIPSTPVLSVFQPTCGGTTGTVMVINPLSGVMYSFDNGTSYQVGNAKGGLQSGVYKIKLISTASGCESTSVSATVNAAPTVPATPTVSVVQPSCTVATGTITVTSPISGVEYSFDNGATYQASNVKNGLASGVYVMKVKSTLSGCESASVSATVNAAPTVPATPTVSVVQPSCTLATGTITVTSPISGVEYSFDNGATYQASASQSGLASGVYVVKVKSTLSGCESASVSATVNAALTVPATPTVSVVQPSCTLATGTITVTSPISGVEYSFDNGATYQASASQSGLASGVYVVKVKSTLSGCESTSVSATVNAAPTVPATPTVSVVQPSCTLATGTITVTSPISGVEYSFDNGATYQASASQSGLASGVYVVKVKSTLTGCESEPMSATVNAIPAVPATLTVSVVQPSCTLATGTITLLSPISGVEYSFDNGATYQASASQSGLASGVYVVKVKSTLTGCESEPMSATVNAAPTVPATPTVSVVQPSCTLATGTITVTSPISGVEYSFDNGATYQASASQSGLASGGYVVKVKSMASGCESTLVSATVNATPAILATPTVSVVQPSCTLATGTITVTLPTDGVEYSFDNGATYQASASQSGLASGVYVVKVKSTLSGCESEPMSATVNAAPAVLATPTVSVVQPSCTLATGTITVTSPISGVEYSFDNGATYQASASQSGLASGVYIVKVKSTLSGCESEPMSATVSAAPAAPATPTVSVVQPSCTLVTGTITVTSPISGVEYSFDNGATYQASNVKSGLALGVYIVKVKSTLSGCESTSVSATVNAAPTVPATPTVSVVQPSCTLATGTITVTSPISGVEYSFDNGATYQASASQSGLASGVYIVKVKSMASGCESTPVSATVNAAPAVPATPTVSVVQPSCAVATGSLIINSIESNVVYSFNNGQSFQLSSTQQGITPGASFTILTKNEQTGCQSDPVVATVNVLGNCPPIATPNQQTVVLGSSVSGNILENDSDPDSGTLTVTSIYIGGIAYNISASSATTITIGNTGTLIMTSTGNYVFIPAPMLTGIIPDIIYTIADGQGGSASSMLTILVVKLPLQLIEPVYNCQTGVLLVSIRGGDGTPVEFKGIGLTDWTFATSFTLSAGLRDDPKTLLFYARQSGVVTAYSFDMVAACGDCLPGPGKKLRLKEPVLTCKESRVCLSTCGGDGSPVSYKIDNVSEWSMLSCVMVGDDLVHRDPKILFIRVKQGDQEQLFEYNLPAASAACPDSTRPWNQPIPTIPAPPSVTITVPGSPTGATGQPLTIINPLYGCSTGVITFRYDGGDGTPVEFMAIGITGWTLLPIHHVEDALRLEQPTIQINARQGSTILTYTVNLKDYCQKVAVPPILEQPPTITPPSPVTTTTPTEPLALVAPDYNCQTGTFTFKTRGGSGNPIQFMAIGITGWSTQPNQVVDEGIRSDPGAGPLLLFARQDGVVVSLNWDIGAACRAAGRSGNRVETLTARLLSNPTLSETVTIAVTCSGQLPLSIRCIDVWGRLISEQQIQALTGEEIIRVRVGNQPGVYLVHISTVGEVVSLKAVKQ